VRKPRSDSLYQRLKDAGQLDEFFAWYLDAGGGYDDIHARLEGYGCDASDAAIHTLIHVHSLTWKVERASAAADASVSALPKNADAVIAGRVKEQEFDLVFGELTHKEQLALMKLQFEREKHAFDVERFRESIKSSVVKGLDALAEQARGNAEAMKHYRKFRAAVMQSIEEAA